MQSKIHSSQTKPHYSLLSLMYGHQFSANETATTADAGNLVQQSVIATHIEDLCDCV